MSKKLESEKVETKLNKAVKQALKQRKINNESDFETKLWEVIDVAREYEKELIKEHLVCTNNAAFA